MAFDVTLNNLHADSVYSSICAMACKTAHVSSCFFRCHEVEHLMSWGIRYLKGKEVRIRFTDFLKLLLQIYRFWPARPTFQFTNFRPNVLTS